MAFNLLQIALGGALGAVARALTQLGAARLFGTGFPIGTMIANVAGCLAMGVLYVLLVERGDGRFAPFLMTGVLGGYTTFSAFALDTMNIAARGEGGLVLLYAGGSVVLSLIAVLAGAALARGIL